MWFKRIDLPKMTVGLLQRGVPQDNAPRGVTATTIKFNMVGVHVHSNFVINLLYAGYYLITFDPPDILPKVLTYVNSMDLSRLPVLNSIAKLNQFPRSPATSWLPLT